VRELILEQIKKSSGNLEDFLMNKRPKKYDLNGNAYVICVGVDDMTADEPAGRRVWEIEYQDPILKRSVTKGGP
jgi:hypothetical protein